MAPHPLEVRLGRLARGIRCPPAVRQPLDRRQHRGRERAWRVAALEASQHRNGQLARELGDARGELAEVLRL